MRKERKLWGKTTCQWIIWGTGYREFAIAEFKILAMCREIGKRRFEGEKRKKKII